MENRLIGPIYAFLAFVFILVLFRFLIFFRFVLLFALIGGLGFLAYYYWNAYRKRKSFDESTEGRLLNRISEYHDYLGDNQKEQDDIEEEIKELKREQSKLDPQANKTQWGELGALIQSFNAERELRETKARFFQRSIEKLQKMLDQYRLNKTIADKKANLEKLQDKHYESLAEFENLKTDVEIDILQLETIEELTKRIQSSVSPDDAIRLRKELEELTNELD